MELELIPNFLNTYFVLYSYYNKPNFKERYSTMKTENKLVTDFIKPFLKHLAGFFGVVFAHFWVFMGFGLCLADRATKESPWMGLIVVIWAIGCIIIVAGIRTFMEYKEKKENENLYGTNN